jgi:hypothetical protein
MVGGGTRMKPQEDSLNTAVDLVVATPGRLLMHVEEGNMAYGDLKYVVCSTVFISLTKGITKFYFLGAVRISIQKKGQGLNELSSSDWRLFSSF